MTLKPTFIAASFCLTVLTTSPILAGDFKITDPNMGHQIFTDALNAKDLGVLVDLYSEDAVMIAPGNTEVRGKEAIHAFFVETLKSIVSIELDTVFRINYADTVVFRSNYTVVFKGEDGQLITQKPAESRLSAVNRMAHGCL